MLNEFIPHHVMLAFTVSHTHTRSLRMETTANPHPLALFILLPSFIHVKLSLSSLSLPPNCRSSPQVSNSLLTFRTLFYKTSLLR